MSIAGLNWAWEAPVSQSTHRLILVALGDMANESWEVYPSWEYMIKKTCLSRNTVGKVLANLRDMGAITDTGERKGRTDSVVVYRLNKHDKWSSTKNGTARSSTKIGTQAVPNLTISSTKIGIQNPKGTQKEPTYTKSKKTPIPKRFSISERVKKWAEEKGHTNLEDHLENFVLASEAKGYKYVDWDKAFMNAIRNNWAKIDNNNHDDPLEHWV